MLRKYTKAAFATNSNLNKIELLKKAVNLYQGDLLESAAGTHWLMQESNYWHLQYISAVNLLLEAFSKYDEYSSIQDYAERSLKIASGNETAYYWLIWAYIHLQAPEIARATLERARIYLTEDDCNDLTAKMEEMGIIIPILQL